MHIFNLYNIFLEIAKDWLHAQGKYVVKGGIISPVHQAYGKKVHDSLIIL